jgi:quinohemoprotein ethanol dehydrogenase
VPGVDRGGNITNLGYSSTETIANLENWLFKGAAKDRGMPDFSGRLKPEDADKLRAFIQGTADAIRPKAK